MLNELPNGWSRTTLGAVTTVKARIGWRGLSASEYTEDGPFLIAGKHIRSGVIDWAACDHLPTFRYDESPEIQMRAGDVIFSKDGSIGNPALIENLPGPATINGTMMMVRSDTEHLDPSYLYQVVCGADFHRMVREKVSGSSIPHIFQRDIVHFPVVLPPLDEQRRIAEVLRSVDEAIATAQDAARDARVLQSPVTTDRCFGHDFDMVRLGDILTDIRYGTSVKCDASEADGHPVLRIPNVVNGRVEQDDLKYAMVSDADLRRFRLQTYDVVVVRTNGNPAYIGRSALIDDSASQFLFASYLIRMRFDCLRAWPPYVYAALNSGPIREKLLKAATTSAGNYNINTASLKNISIPLPSLEMQHQISGIIQAVTEAAIACERAAESSRRAKADLASDLLSGRVRVPA